MIAQTSDGRNVYFSIVGSGPEILLIHGAGSDADSMAPLAAQLSDRYRCISVDRLGYRRSTRLDRDTTAEEQGQAIAAVHKACTTEPLWVFGHSSGGNVALGYASHFPGDVRGLVLMEPALYALYPSEAPPPTIGRMRNDIIPLFQRGDIGDGLRGFVKLFDTSPATFEALARLPRPPDPLENWLPFAYDQPFVMDWRPSDADLQQLPHPTLVIEGDRSAPLLRDMCRLLAAKLPGAELATMADCDHLAPLLKPALVAERIAEFIERHRHV